MSETDPLGLESAEAAAGLFSRARDRFDRALWGCDLERLNRVSRAGVRGVRMLELAFRGFLENHAPTRAAALTYVTMLSLVPLLAFAFAVAKGLGAYDRLLEAVVLPWLDEVSPRSVGVEANNLRAAIDQVLQFVGRTSFQSLGALGLVATLFAAIKMLGNVEQAFNDIWGSERRRSWIRKLTDYVAILVVTPIFLVASAAITTALGSAGARDWLREDLGLGPASGWLFSGLTAASMCVAFTFLYECLPYVRPRLKSALVGGIVAGLAWHVFQTLHVRFQIGVARFNPVYASFAALPIFLGWLFASWQIVLYGMELAHAHQCDPAWRRPDQSGASSHAFREKLGLRAAVRVVAAWLAGEPAPGAAALATALCVPERQVGEALGRLAGARILVEAGGGRQSGVWLPAKPPESVAVADVLRALRGAAQPAALPARGRLDQSSDVAFDAVERAASAGGSASLRAVAEEALRAREREREALLQRRGSS